MSEPRTDQTVPGALRLSLDFLFGRGYLAARDHRLAEWALVEELRLEIPDLRFPVSVGGGFDRFRHVRCQARHVRLSIPEPALRDRIAQIEDGVEGFSDVHVVFLDGAIELSARSTILSASGWFACRLGVVPSHDDPALLRLTAYDYFSLGTLPCPTPVLVRELLSRLVTDPRLSPLVERFLPSVDGDTIEIPAVRLLASELLVRRGWKLPGVEDLHRMRVDIRPGRLTLVATADTPADADDTESVTGDRGRALAALESKAIATAARDAEMSGDLEAAADAYRDAIRRYGAHPFLADRLLDTLVSGGSPAALAEAEELISQRLVADGDDLGGRAFAARAQMIRGERQDYVAACEALLRVLATTGRATEHMMTLVHLAEVLVDEEPDQARRWVDEALKHAPRHATALRVLAGVARRSADFTLLEDALKRLASVLRGRRARIRVLEELARVSWERRGDAAAARLHLERAMELGPDDPSLVSELAALLASEGRTVEAIHAYHRAADRFRADNPAAAADAWLAASVLWEERLDDRENASLDVRRAITAQPGNAAAAERAVHLAVALDRVDDALRSLDIALTLAESAWVESPTDEHRARLGRVLSASAALDDRRGRSDAAAHTRARLLAIVPEDDAVLDALQSYLTSMGRAGDLAAIVEGAAADAPADVAPRLRERAGIAQPSPGWAIPGPEEGKPVSEGDTPQPGHRTPGPAAETASTAPDGPADTGGAAPNDSAGDALPLQDTGARRVAEALTVAKRALEDARTVDDPKALADALTEVAAVETDGNRRAAYLSELGQLLYFEFEDAPRARDYLEEARRLDPDRAGSEFALLSALEAIYDEMSAPDGLVDVYRRKLSQAQDDEIRNVYGLLIAGVLFERLGQPDEACEFLDEILARDPRNVAALRLHAAIDAGAERFDAAATGLRSLVAMPEIDPFERQDVLRMLGALEWQDLRDHESAASRFETLLGEIPGDTDALSALKQIYGESERWTDYVDLLLRELGILAGAIDRFGSVDDVLSARGDIVPDPLQGTFATILVEAADVLDRRVADPTLALALATAAAQRAPDDPAIHEARASLARKVGDDDALAAALRALVPMLLSADERQALLQEAADAEVRAGRTIGRSSQPVAAAAQPPATVDDHRTEPRRSDAEAEPPLESPGDLARPLPAQAEPQPAAEKPSRPEKLDEPDGTQRSVFTGPFETDSWESVDEVTQLRLLDRQAESGERDAALAHLAAWLPRARRPDLRRQLLLRKGRWLLAGPEPRDALLPLKGALILDGDSAETRFELTRAYAAVGDVTQAVDQLRELLDTMASASDPPGPADLGATLHQLTELPRGPRWEWLIQLVETAAPRAATAITRWRQKTGRAQNDTKSS